jgi:magnesium chelatase family protein
MPKFQFTGCSHLKAEPSLITLEVFSSLQIPGLFIIGLAGQEIQEAKERVRAAILSLGQRLPQRKLVVNLSPSSEKKSGTHLDLPIALALLSHGIESSGPPIRVFAWGELGLEGEIKPTDKVLRPLYCAWKRGASVVFGPPIPDWVLPLLRKSENLGSIPEPIYFPVQSLQESWDILKELNQESIITRQKALPQEGTSVWPENQESSAQDENLLPLHPRVLKALILSELGQLHLVILGPKGAGKSHALSWRKALQGPPSPEQILQSILLRELGSGESSVPPTLNPIVREVGPEVRPASLVGSSRERALHPGELTLAHGGLLITDEVLEWARDARECLRIPLETSFVYLSRVDFKETLPAHWVWVATSNLCACGGWPLSRPRQVASTQVCRCGVRNQENYLARLSGPLRDRVDLLIVVETCSSLRESTPPDAIDIDQLKEQIKRRRQELSSTLGQPPGLMTGRECEAFLAQNPDLKSQFDELSESMTLRRRHKLLRVALTHAAWEGRTSLSLDDLLIAATFYEEWPWS